MTVQASMDTESLEFTNAARRFARAHAIPSGRVDPVGDGSDQATRAELRGRLRDLGCSLLLTSSPQPDVGARRLSALFRTVGACPIPASLLDEAVLAPALLQVGTIDSDEFGEYITGGARAALAMTFDVGRHAEVDLWAGVELRSSGAFGRKTMVADLDAVDDLIVTALGPDGPTIARVPRAAVRRTSMPTFDRVVRLDVVEFDGASFEVLLMGEADAPSATRHLLGIGRLAIMSELLGAAEEALRMSIEYAQIRVQFGSPIGSYQAVKHILADMAVDVAVSSSLVDSAIVAVDSVPLSLAAYARIEQAKAHVAQAVVRVLENALQVHGGIGYTSEYRLSLLFHRVLALRALWGDPDKCALRLGAKRMGRQ